MTDWYIKPKEWFENKQQFELAQLICEVFDAQEIIGIDERDKERNPEPVKKRRRRNVNSLSSSRRIPKKRG